MKPSLPVAPRRLLLAVAGAQALAWLAGCERGGRAAAHFKAMDITGADFARSLQLPDADGRLRSLDEFKGKVVVLFFGYTQCPDVCPTTMLQLADIRKRLGKDGDRVQGVFVTVDPERDTPQVLKAYVANFDPTFIALRGNAEQTAAAAREFKVFYRKQGTGTDAAYTVDHTASAFVFDPQGQVRLYSRYGAPADDLLSDLKQLLAA